MSDSDIAAGGAPVKASALAQLGNLFVAPSQALDYAREHPKMWWLPLGITLVLNAALGVWVALTLDLAAWRATMVQIFTRSNPEHASQAIAMISHHGRGYLLLGVVSGVVAIGVIELLYALYLFLADKLFSADSRSYGRWFSFTAWTWLPISIGYIAAMIAWAISSHGAGFDQLAVTSLNTLFFHLKPGDKLFGLAQFSILQFWVIGLAAFGLKRWCGHGTGKAIGIAVLPYIVVYGIIYLV